MSIQMKISWPRLIKIALFSLLTGLAAFYWLSGGGHYLSFTSLKENRDVLKQYVEAHHGFSVALFMAFYISTAFFVPGAVAFTLVAGFLFGVVEAAVYVDVSATVGAVLAFLSSRYLVGRRIQERFAKQIAGFNREMKRYGSNYLFVLRVIPLMPFALVNYLAGLTTISLRKFTGITSAGMLPGAFLYAYAGRRLATINNPDDLLSPGLITAFAVLTFISLLPVFLRRWRESAEETDHGKEDRH